MRFLRWIAFLLMLAALAFVARPYLRGLAFVARSAGIQGTPGRLAEMDASAAAEREFDIPLTGGPMHARVYEPSPRRGRAALLVPPPGADSIAEPQLVAMARQLAASGLTIVTPAVPELTRYEIVPAATTAIEQTALWLSSETALVPDGKVGLIGVGFSGGLAVVAAGRRTLSNRLAYVLTLGGHHDLPRVLRYLCTGTEPRPGNRIQLGANTTDQDPTAFVGLPADYGVGMLLAGVAPRVVPAAQVQPLREAVLRVLATMPRERTGEPGRGADLQAAGDAAKQVPEPSATLLRYLAGGDLVHLGVRLLPHIAAYGGDAALSPSRSPKPTAPVFVLHRSDDNLVPEVEAEYLAEELRGRSPVKMLITDVIPGAASGRTISPGDALKLAGFWGDLLSR